MKRFCCMVVMLVVLLITASMVCMALDLDEINKVLKSTEWEEVASWKVDSNGNIIENGLRLLGRKEGDEQEIQKTAYDGRWEIAQKGGRFAALTVKAESPWMLLYFDIDDDLLFDVKEGTKIVIKFDYYDEGIGDVAVEYVSWQNAYDWNGYIIQKLMANQWKTYEMLYMNARFNNKQQDVADFRIVGKDKDMAISNVSILVAK